MVKYTCQSFKTFVANRVAKVQELTEGFSGTMCHLFSTQQILCLGDLRHCDLPNLRLWWHGPQFLEKVSCPSEETSLSPVKECGKYSKGTDKWFEFLYNYI
ncbi:hypothetical protein TNCV_2580591 [Trichonephila clavipes]|nr:hypothetical protein TNCV_2580591 [Trichonephila clavipes]